MRTSFTTVAGVLSAALVLATASLAARADVVAGAYNGIFANDAEVANIDFSVTSSSDLRVWTTSWAAGSFDTVLSFFNLQNGALLSFSDDVGNPYPEVDLTQGQLDAGIELTDLAPGLYRVTVTASPNLPAGQTLADGFTIVSAGTGPAPGAWSAQLRLLDAAPIPEPSAFALVSIGLLCLGMRAQRRGR